MNVTISKCIQTVPPVLKIFTTAGTFYVYFDIDTFNLI